MKVGIDAWHIQYEIAVSVFLRNPLTPDAKLGSTARNLVASPAGLGLSPNVALQY